ncbi:acyl carrier protein [Gammaproteobacteria bacterium]|nr:acyl carrier protein [Gammaproteobacteria bacterium]MDB4242851.1 acyl carrier protein [Gammaproteobacteria bacterium]
MTREEILKKVESIFRDIFDEDELLVIESTNSDDIEDWDSLNHINLVTSIEREFGIKFTLEELTNLPDVGAMISLMLRKLSH